MPKNKKKWNREHWKIFKKLRERKKEQKSQRARGRQKKLSAKQKVKLKA